MGDDQIVRGSDGPLGAGQGGPSSIFRIFWVPISIFVLAYRHFLGFSGTILGGIFRKNFTRIAAKNADFSRSFRVWRLKGLFFLNRIGKKLYNSLCFLALLNANAKLRFWLLFVVKKFLAAYPPSPPPAGALRVSFFLFVFVSLFVSRFRWAFWTQSTLLD